MRPLKSGLTLYCAPTFCHVVAPPAVTQSVANVVTYGACQARYEQVVNSLGLPPKGQYFPEDAPYYAMSMIYPNATYWLVWEDGSTFCEIRSFFY